MNRSAVRHIAALATAIAIGCGDATTQTSERAFAARSVVLISIDTLRRDHVSAYGYERETTPNIDTLARNGVLFESASSTTNWTLPAHMSMLTGLMPSSHGVEDRNDRLPEATRTLAQAFRAGGLRTGGFASHVYLDAKYGFGAGFDRYDVVPDRRAERTTQRALHWLDEQGDAAFFLFIHYFDPHWPYRAPEPYRHAFGRAPAKLGELAELYQYYSKPMPPGVTRDVKKLYDAEIAYTDHHLGRIVTWLADHDRLASTVIAVTSDHGEEFGDHGGFGHAGHLHTEVTTVPLVIHPAHAPSSDGRGWPKRYSLPVSIADLPATLLELAGAPPEPQFTREADKILPDDVSVREVLTEATHRGPKRFAIRSGTQRYFSAGYHLPITFETDAGRTPIVPMPIETALYDVVSDPGEQRNLYAGDPGRATPLEEGIERFVLRTMRGLMLQCRIAPGEQLEAAVSFDLEPFDEPFALTPGAAVSADDDDPERFLVTLIGQVRRSASVVFPVNAGYVTLELDRGSSADSASEIEISRDLAVPTPGTRIDVATGDGATRCTLIGGARAATGAGSVTLSAEERERLRALGYGD